jgi:hypothetical protein
MGENKTNSGAPELTEEEAVRFAAQIMGQPAGDADGEQIPPAEALKAYFYVREYFQGLDRLIKAMHAFEDMLPRKKRKLPYTEKSFKNEFFGTPENADRVYKLQEGLSPVSVSLVALHDFFERSGRFIHTDPTKLPGMKKLPIPYDYEEPTWTLVKLGPHSFTVPGRREMWVEDTFSGKKFVVSYGLIPTGLRIQIEGSWTNSEYVTALVKDIKDAILTSQYFRGQILELTPRGFQIIELPEQRMPVIDPILLAELDKNIINVFKKAEEFKSYKLGLRSSVIIEGLPGNGKTMIARYLAQTLKGQVTVFWVTSKAIERAEHIGEIFEMARKLSPVLLIMEDIDLIAGTRESNSECLGEMLAQLDGIQPNESLVLVASTNRVKALDEALRDRPGRFDRIYALGSPSPELAEQIAQSYLGERGLKPETIQALNFNTVMRGDLTGAQVVEVCKGAIKEAIHRGCEVNALCLTASYNGLMNQRKLIHPEG